MLSQILYYSSTLYVPKVGFAMTTYHHDTHKPVIGFDMGGTYVYQLVVIALFAICVVVVVIVFIYWS